VHPLLSPTASAAQRRYGAGSAVAGMATPARAAITGASASALSASHGNNTSNPSSSPPASTFIPTSAATPYRNAATGSAAASTPVPSAAPPPAPGLLQSAFRAGHAGVASAIDAVPRRAHEESLHALEAERDRLKEVSAATTSF
jgi:hypothetical protein